MKRIFIDVLLLILVFFVPWWVVLLAALGAMIVFRSFYEIMFLGIIIDSLYNAPIALFYGFEFVVTASVVVLFVLMELLKRRLRFYEFF